MARRGQRRGEDDSPLTPLPAGRHGLPRAFVVENQRARLIVGIVRTVARRGYDATTITAIAEAASVSRHTFYDNFQNKEECFLAAYDRALQDLEAEIADAPEPGATWARRTRAGLAALLGFFAADPELARFFWLDSLGGGETIVNRHRESMRSLIELLARGHPPNPALSRTSQTAADAMVGGIVALIAKRVSAAESDRLGALLPDLLELILAPYLGDAEAQRIAAESR
jgi:AcrR family transcriptional regulator